jgi:hypothetical protein
VTRSTLLHLEYNNNNNNRVIIEHDDNSEAHTDGHYSSTLLHLSCQHFVQGDCHTTEDDLYAVPQLTVKGPLCSPIPPCRGAKGWRFD